MIYFIACEGSDFIKVGFANDVKRRLSALQIGSPNKLSVVASFAGSRQDEAALHRALMFRGGTQGEWFEGRAARALARDIERLGMAPAIELWTKRVEEATAWSREQCRAGASRVLKAVNAAFDKLIERLGADEVKRKLGMSEATIRNRRFHGADAINVFLLSEPDQREALAAAHRELVREPVGERLIRRLAELEDVA